MFRVNEIFRSIQGEGPAIGEPATFIRLAGCNLSCSYCDTDHVPFQRRQLDDLLSQIAPGPSRVVLTGGEPLLAGDALLPLAAGIASAGKILDIETNGTLQAPPGLADYVENFVISPKLAASGNDPAKSALAADLPDGPFKFAVGHPAELDEIEKIAKLHPERQILVMPLGTDAQVMLARMAELRTDAEARGWRLLPRLHVLLGIR